MKYFLDTEFLEGTQSKRFLGIKYGETKPTIDLISIGLVSEDGREYYAISKDFNLWEAWNRNDLDPNHKRNYKQKDNYWIRENVLKPIWRELYIKENDFGNLNNLLGWLNREYTNNENYYFTYNSLKKLINKYGKTNKHIAQEILKFYRDEVLVAKINGKLVGSIDPVRGNPKFYAYYADYDWVVFCQLFGKMIDLPKGFPMYCKDLKQLMDEKISQDNLEINDVKIPNYDLDKKLQTIKNIIDYPKQTNEHNALTDAKWNKELYNFLNKI